MKEFTTYRTTRAIELIIAICNSEKLDVQTRYETNALGDDVIIVKGDKEEIETLKQIFNMVY